MKCTKCDSDKVFLLEPQTYNRWESVWICNDCGYQESAKKDNDDALDEAKE